MLGHPRTENAAWAFYSPREGRHSLRARRNKDGQDMQPTEATALGLVVFGGIAAVVGVAGLMERRPRAGLVLLWAGIAAIGAACVALVVMPY